MRFFVYSIYNQKADKFYIGQTKDLNNRIEFHNNKLFKGYTAKFPGHWDLIYSEEVCSRDAALKREKQLKSYRGREFIKNIIYKYSEVALRQLAEVAQSFIIYFIYSEVAQR